MKESIHCQKAIVRTTSCYRERKLKFLQAMRDDLETRLAGLNAAIETIERQLNREDAAA